MRVPNRDVTFAYSSGSCSLFLARDKSALASSQMAG